MSEPLHPPPLHPPAAPPAPPSEGVLSAECLVSAYQDVDSILAAREAVYVASLALFWWALITWLLVIFPVLNVILTTVVKTIVPCATCPPFLCLYEMTAYFVDTVDKQITSRLFLGTRLATKGTESTQDSASSATATESTQDSASSATASTQSKGKKRLRRGASFLLVSLTLVGPWAFFFVAFGQYNALEKDFTSLEPPPASPFGWRVCEVSFEYLDIYGCTCSLSQNGVNGADVCSGPTPQVGRGKDTFCDFVNDPRLRDFGMTFPVVIPLATPWFGGRWSLYTPFLYACLSSAAHLFFVAIAGLRFVWDGVVGTANPCARCWRGFQACVPCCRPWGARQVTDSVPQITAARSTLPMLALLDAYISASDRDAAPAARWRGAYARVNVESEDETSAPRCV